MRSIKHYFDDCDTSTQLNLYVWGDQHFGHPGVDVKRFQKFVNMVEDDPDGYWVGTGDHLHLITLKDARYKSDTLPDWMLEGGAAEVRKRLADIVTAQKMMFLDLVEPIAHKCLGLLAGNHERAIEKHHERNIHSEVVDAVRALSGFDHNYPLNLGYSGWLTLSFSRGRSKGKRGGVKTITTHFHHGASIGDARWRKYIMETEADIVAWGHSHKLEVKPFPIRAINGAGAPIEKYRWGAWTGTLQKDTVEGQETWGETRGHMSPIGCVKFTIEPYAYNEYQVISGQPLIL